MNQSILDFLADLMVFAWYINYQWTQFLFDFIININAACPHHLNHVYFLEKSRKRKET